MAKRFAPRDGRGGLNRAWAGGAGSRGPLSQRFASVGEKCGRVSGEDIGRWQAERKKKSINLSSLYCALYKVKTLKYAL